MKPTRLGDVLVRHGKITREKLAEIVREAKLSGDTLTTALVKAGVFSEKELASFIAKTFGRPLVDLDKVEVDPKKVVDVAADVMQRLQILPLKRKGNVLVCAVADPYDINAIDEFRFITGSQIEVVIALESQLMEKLGGLSSAEEKLEEVMNELGATEVDVVETEPQEADAAALAAATEASPVVKLVNFILLDAIKRGASDIHIEPYEKVLRVRYRVDGVLQEVMRPPLAMRDAIVSRIKVLAKLDISERRVPQDGRIKLRLSKAKAVDFRVSVLPTLFGEKVVMRLLDPSSLMLDMTKLGYSEQALKWFKDAIHKPYGMVLVTGPTGSGKTVSLYSAIAELNRPEINISTAEDPVEFNFMGINQVNVNPDVGLDFPTVLRAFLRQDPDVILIGEIRDRETAEIGIKAALTGHLVLATLHTNDAPSTVVRLVNMGIEHFLVGSALNLVSAQRLARRICANCKEPDTDTPPEAFVEAGMPEEEIGSFQPMRGRGCEKCGGTGYKGRIGIYQVMPITEEIRQAIYAGKNADEINEIAISQGVKTLRMDALDKVKQGIITLDECLRVTIGD